ncbi:VOC family protein [Phenylobacterium sp. LjRoot219]|uniref:VOC family protein n=1 Tax=Phenylobacterium sp. LjRoot219 TaxID=3342283 RepID=UPI003ECC5AB2
MLEGFHYQNAYVTRDIDKWIEEFKKRGKVDRVMTYEGTTEVTTPNGKGSQTNKLAFIWVGDLQYELIQPGSGDVSIYSDALPADDGLQFHHICMRVPDWDEFRARVDQQPFPVVLEGGNELLRFLYLDARPFLGHYLEYTWMGEERWAQMGGPPQR